MSVISLAAVIAVVMVDINPQDVLFLYLGKGCKVLSFWEELE